MSKLNFEYFLKSDVVEISKNLIGKILYTNVDGEITAGIISETEAYAGPGDKASHAYNNRRTSRTEVMYGRGGIAYVYLCYGIHHLFNIVTNVEGIPHAVLIRGIIPYLGIETMLLRRKKTEPKLDHFSGPGSAASALGIHTSMSGTSLSGNRIWLEDIKLKIPDYAIYNCARIGIDYAGDDAKLPYRFLIKHEHSKKIFEKMRDPR